MSLNAYHLDRGFNSDIIDSLENLVGDAALRERAAPRLAEAKKPLLPAVPAEKDGVSVRPQARIERRVVSLDGIVIETIDADTRERVDFHYRGEAHLLVVHGQGVRRAGETVVGGARATLHDLSRRLTFVPAGQAYHEWMEAGSYPQIMYVYFDAARFLTEDELQPAGVELTPRALFEDAALWQAAQRLRDLLLDPSPVPQRHLHALGTVLAFELAHANARLHAAAPLARGGLAAWQRRVVAKYIDENLGERIALKTLADLVHLSPFHFCRAFKQSFGLPPHRYHTSRRILRAKAMLESTECSVTDIGMTLGFSETSSFCTAFRKATGLSPTAYHRSVA